MKCTIAAALAIFSFTGGWARADEQSSTLAEVGDWSAMDHRQSETAAPDICVAFNTAANFGFRVSSDSMEARITNSGWSLPAHVTGTIVLSVGGQSFSNDVSSNTAVMAAATVAPVQIISLLDKMEASGAMTITVGAGKPINVSLAGSKVVLTAFRTCAGIPGDTGGTNPFK